MIIIMIIMITIITIMSSMALPMANLHANNFHAV